MPPSQFTKDSPFPTKHDHWSRHSSQLVPRSVRRAVFQRGFTAILLPAGLTWGELAEHIEEAMAEGPQTSQHRERARGFDEDDRFALPLDEDYDDDPVEMNTLHVMETEIRTRLLTKAVISPRAVPASATEIIVGSYNKDKVDTRRRALLVDESLKSLADELVMRELGGEGHVKPLQRNVHQGHRGSPVQPEVEHVIGLVNDAVADGCHATAFVSVATENLSGERRFRSSRKKIPKTLVSLRKFQAGVSKQEGVVVWHELSAEGMLYKMRQDRTPTTKACVVVIVLRVNIQPTNSRGESRNGPDPNNASSLYAYARHGKGELVGTGEQWERLRDADVRVIAVANNPQSNIDPCNR